jgi:hypothetical protein
MRITVDIADSVLEEVRREQERQGKSLREMITELLAEGLAVRRAGGERRELRWIAKNLGSGIDLRDKEALWAELDADDEGS